MSQYEQNELIWKKMKKLDSNQDRLRQQSDSSCLSLFAERKISQLAMIYEHTFNAYLMFNKLIVSFMYYADITTVPKRGSLFMF